MYGGRGRVSRQIRRRHRCEQPPTNKTKQRLKLARCICTRCEMRDAGSGPPKAPKDPIVGLGGGPMASRTKTTKKHDNRDGQQGSKAKTAMAHRTSGPLAVVCSPHVQGVAALRARAPHPAAALGSRPHTKRIVANGTIVSVSTRASRPPINRASIPGGGWRPPARPETDER
jgi:hypothetical protein